MARKGVFGIGLLLKDDAETADATEEINEAGLLCPA